MAVDLDRILQQVLRQLETERRLLDQRIEAVSAVTDGVPRSASPGQRPRRRRMSAAARREVGRRMKAYWAKRRAGKTRAGAAETRGDAGQLSMKRTASAPAVKHRARG